MQCALCGSVVSDLPARQLASDVANTPTEINVAAFRRGDLITLLFVPLEERRIYRLYHASRQHGFQEQILYGKHTHARVVMGIGDSLLVLGMRTGFPMHLLRYDTDGIVRFDNGGIEYLNMIIGDVDAMSRYLDPGD